MSDMSLPKELPFFLSKNEGLIATQPEDDLLHPDSFKNVSDDSATETQYFGFSIPEENIHALTYTWHHPNLNVVSGGLFVYQGVKPSTVHCEICDWRQFMDDSVLKNDLHDYRLDNGYGVKIIEPMNRFHITYDDAARKNSVDVQVEAVLPAVMFGDGNHFEQTMKVKGELVLRGKKYDVDSYTVRDRSWGKPRQEILMPLPPSTWNVGTFSDDFSFNCAIIDSAKNNPLLTGDLVLPEEDLLTGGWVYRDGKLGRIVKANKKCTRVPHSLETTSVELQFTDEHGREFDMKGTLIASAPIQTWINVMMRVNLMSWECDGQTGYGDLQEAFWGDYLTLENNAHN